MSQQSTSDDVSTGPVQPDSQAKQHNVASFLLRFTQDLWQDAEDDSHVRWRGHIRHVQGDKESRFTDFAQAVAFIQQNLSQLTMDTLSGEKNMSQEKIFAESFKLWEQFATSYTDIMQSAMEQTLKQSELINKQVEAARTQTMKAWNLPQPAGEQADLFRVMQALQEQVATLTARVAMLEETLQSEKDA
ncbi:MAG: hypothetical protein KDD78_01780 [Caldilineaceae bacterium]|nr:hypothetical protein [Caldilineaceae bacterium]